MPNGSRFVQGTSAGPSPRLCWFVFEIVQIDDRVIHAENRTIIMPSMKSIVEIRSTQNLLEWANTGMPWLQMIIGQLDWSIGTAWSAIRHTGHRCADGTERHKMQNTTHTQAYNTSMQTREA
jgi:hypothetical protein